MFALACVAAGSTVTRAAAPDDEGAPGSAPVADADEAPEREELLGAWIPDLELALLERGATPLSALVGPAGLVVVVRDPDCPVAMKYAPRLRRLEAELPERGFGLLFLNPYSAEDAERDVELFGFTSAYAFDPEELVIAALDARTTTEVFVLDAARTVRYRGAIDDQYSIGSSKEAPTERYLEDALAAVRRGVRLVRPITGAPGCLLAPRPVESLSPDALPPPTTRGTWNEDIARLVQRRCEPCHHAGGAAPFALTTLEEVERRKDMVRFVVEDERMPPWGVEGPAAPWRNALALAEQERAQLLAWLADGLPAGDPARAPVALRWDSAWTLGEPDLVLEAPPVALPAEGAIDYRYVTVDPGFAEDRWIEGVELRFAASATVRGAALWIDGEQPDSLARARARFGEPGGYLASAAPGQSGLRHPAGFARRVPAGARLTLQLLVTPRGVATEERARIGLHLAAAAPAREVLAGVATDPELKLLRGVQDASVRGEYVFERPGELLSFWPHTHARGKRFRYQLVHADGRAETVLWIPRFGFAWPLRYELREPLAFAAGARLVATAWYDNSADSPDNPDPSALVRFGPAMADEVLGGCFEWSPRAPESALGSGVSGDTSGAR